MTVIIPARDEAAVLPLTLPTLLEQDYPGQLRVVLIDDQSSDGTAAVAAELGKSAGWLVKHEAVHEKPKHDEPRNTASPTTQASQATEATQASQATQASADRELLIISGAPLPDGWAGKVWAMSQGVAAAGDSDYLLFTDADIAYHQGTVAQLATAATDGRFALVSQMALLRAKTGWEKLLIPAFVYFFAQLYPFRLVNRERSRTAAAAGGCMLVHRGALEEAGGVSQIRAARIDDVAFGTLLKRSGAKCWLGLTTDVISDRAYPQLSQIWDMVARSAYTQLGYSLVALAGVILSLSWLYLLPPAAAIAGLASLAAGAGSTAAWLTATGALGWAIMSVTYLPINRFYGLSSLRAVTLPVIAGLYAAMTADSARRHLAGRGGAWKGRTISR
jgi:hopene-associated glycosyltransferase HpnB